MRRGQNVNSTYLLTHLVPLRSLTSLNAQAFGIWVGLRWVCRCYLPSPFSRPFSPFRLSFTDEDAV